MVILNVFRQRKKITLNFLIMFFVITILIFLQSNKVYAAQGWRNLTEGEVITIEEDTYIYSSSSGNNTLKVIRAGEQVSYYKDWTDSRMKIYYDGNFRNVGWIDLDAIPSVRNNMGKYKIQSIDDSYDAGVDFFLFQYGIERVSGKEKLTNGDIIQVLDVVGERTFVRCNNQYLGYIRSTLFASYGGTGGWDFIVPATQVQTDGINPYTSTNGGTSGTGDSAQQVTEEDISLGNLDEYGRVSTGSQKLQNMAEKILGVIQIIGIVVSVMMLIVIGIKYMLGSVEEKAEYKETLKPYLIGAFLVFSVTTIPQIIYKLAQNF